MEFIICGGEFSCFVYGDDDGRGRGPLLPGFSPWEKTRLVVVAVQGAPRVSLSLTLRLLVNAHLMSP